MLKFFSKTSIMVLACMLASNLWAQENPDKPKRPQIAYPIFLDTEDNPAWAAYKVKVVPSMFLVDRQAQIVKQWIGEANWTEVESAVKELLAKS